MSSCPDYIFEIHQLWQSGFSRVYSNCCCNCSFEAEIIKICQSSHKMYSNKIVNFQESTTILNACTKKSGNLLNAPHIYIYIYIYIYCYPQTDCFFLSELFSVARHIGCSKLGLKPIQLYIRLSLRLLSQQVYHAG